MNDIILYEENIGAVTNQITADTHKHWMLQLFVSLEDMLTITINGKIVNSAAILVNINTPHSFSSLGKIHFTLLINPTSKLGRSMKVDDLEKNSYYELTELQLKMIRETIIPKNNYKELMTNIEKAFKLGQVSKYDERIEMLLAEINECDCLEMTHQVSQLAIKMNLSESRLSHLFKQQTEIPLKSYLLLHQLFTAYHKIFDGVSITQAALDSGFDSPAHLSATSKKLTGMSASKINKDSRFLKVLC